MARPRFSQLLLQDKIVTPEQVQSALKTQAMTGELLGSILYARHVLTEDQVAHYLSQVYQTPGVVISKVTPDPKLRELIPQSIAQKFQILPLLLEKKLLSLAVVNPNDYQMIQKVQFMTGCRLQLHVAMQFALRDRMKVYYGAGLTDGLELNTQDSGRGMRITPIAANLEDSQRGSITQEGAPENRLITFPKTPSFSADEIAQSLSQDINEAITDTTKVPPISPDWQGIINRGRTILVVDDDAAIRNLLNDSLKAKGYVVLPVASGREAIEKIQIVRPDLILLDAMLPEIHGFTICKTIKESAKYREIPVIIITAVYTGWRFQLDVKEQYGADEVIEKPFKINHVVDKVKELLDESASFSTESEKKDVELTRKAAELLDRGVGAVRDGEVAQAKELFKQGIQIDPLHPLLHYYLGKCLEKENNLFGAMAAFEKASELDPYLFPVVKDLGILYQRNGFKRKAIEMWERALQVCPREDVREKIKINLIKLL